MEPPAAKRAKTAEAAVVAAAQPALPADWQAQCAEFVSARTDAGDDGALRLLALEGVELGADSFMNRSDIDTGQPSTAAERLARQAAHCGRARVVRWRGRAWTSRRRRRCSAGPARRWRRSRWGPRPW